MKNISEIIDDLEDIKKSLKKTIKEAKEIEQDELVQTFGACPIPGQIRDRNGNCVAPLG